MKLNLKSVTQRIKRQSNRVRAVLVNKKKPRFYAEQGRALQHANQGRQAKQVLDKGLSFYPKSLLIHREYALFLMENDMWNEAGNHWDMVSKSPNKHLLNVDDYHNASKVYLKLKLVEKSIEVLRNGLLTYSEDLNLAHALADSLMTAKKWNEAMGTYLILFEKEGMQASIDVYLGLSLAYQQLGNMDQAEYTIHEAINYHPEDKQLMSRYAQLAIDRHEWDRAIRRYSYLIDLYGHEETLLTELTLTLSMLYQIIGYHNHANELLEQVTINVKNDEAYNKINLFENEGCTIDFYKKIKSNKKVIITFDSRDVNWNESPFGFKLLLRQDVDIIAVRQKKIKTYQQSLSQEDFLTTVTTVIEGYEDKIAYGHSLGGYTALYYAANLNCRILALAPRISIHPIYGDPAVSEQYEFRHKLAHDFNDEIEPIIVYDPRDTMDYTYVHEALMPAFPGANLIELPYSGHGVARHLLRMGVLKEFILTVIDGEIPTYNRKLKGKSANYCRLLGRECLRRGKLNWARDLVDRSLNLLPNDRYGVKLKTDVLSAANGYDVALDYIKKETEKFPRKLSYRIIMIDQYIKMEALIYAEIEINRALTEFKTHDDLINRQEKISEIRKDIISRPADFLNENHIGL